MQQNPTMERALMGWLLLLWLVTAIAPSYRHDWLLENLLVFVAVIALAATRRRFRFSSLAYALISVFLSLHLIGAHYTYSETPLGYWMQDWFGWQRNHYDRLVHFAFGLLIVIPVRELLCRAARLHGHWLWLLSLSVIMAFSALYEAIEAIAAMLISPELGAAYLGTQGDEFDAQKDSLLALLGAILTLLLWKLWGRREQRP